MHPGNVTNLTITLKQISEEPTISGAEIYGIIGAVVAAVVIVGSVMYIRRKKN